MKEPPQKPHEKNIVFLSHSSKDKKQLAEFKKALEAKTNGTIEFFLSSDGQSIPLGHNWVASVEHSLDEAKLAFLLLTANSLDSTWVAFEAGYMHSKGIKVIPVALPGIDLGQITPPINLLQGFNMHSFEAMNNFFEILNKEFQHKHAPSFVQDDFRLMFGADSDFASGFFGEYSAFVRLIKFSGKSYDAALVSILDKELSKLQLALNKTEAKNENNTHHIWEGVGPGLHLHIDMLQHSFSIALHRERFSLLLGPICSAMSATCKAAYRAEIVFSQGVEACGNDIDISARAFGTDFVVLTTQQLGFREIKIGTYNLTHLESPEPFKAEDIRALVIEMFNSGMLELKPVKQIDPSTLALTNAVLRSNLRRF